MQIEEGLSPLEYMGLPREGSTQPTLLGDIIALMNHPDIDPEKVMTEVEKAIGTLLQNR